MRGTGLAWRFEDDDDDDDDGITWDILNMHNACCEM